MTFSSVRLPLGVSRTPSSSTVHDQQFLCSWSGRTRSSSSSRLLRQQNHGFRLQFIPHVPGNYLCIIGIAVHKVPVSQHAVFEASSRATLQPCSTPYTSSAVTVSTLTTGASDADLARDEMASGSCRVYTNLAGCTLRVCFGSRGSLAKKAHQHSQPLCSIAN